MLRIAQHGAGLALFESMVRVSPDPLLRLSALLEERGMVAAAIRPPTVPPGTSRLRIALRASHSEGDVDALLAALEEAR